MQIFLKFSEFYEIYLELSYSVQLCILRLCADQDHYFVTYRACIDVYIIYYLTIRNASSISEILINVNWHQAIKRNIEETLSDKF